MSLLLKPGNLATAASCRPFHAAKASSLPGRTFGGGDQDGRRAHGVIALVFALRQAAKKSGRR